ncbi:MAG: NAD-dependent epimerase [Nitrospirales bacterium]|nr:MAG: NAD-dependent epimerase [Nitrospirales bacterium]
MNQWSNENPVLLTGVTGYVGGRLVGELSKHGCAVRSLARNSEYARARVGEHSECVQADLLKPQSLATVMDGIHTAYYLVHSMGSGESFEAEERQAAENFGRAAERAGVRRIIYLGGLGDDQTKLSAHLRSRHRVGEELRNFNVQVIEFRASVVIGSGSLSFEMVRALVERLPLMITPRWVSVLTQPIAIGDLLQYLIAGLDVEVEGHAVFEIGGTDQVSYGDLMKEYAQQRGLRRVMIPVPFLTPRLSSLWLGLVTPVYARVGRKLIDGIRFPTIVKDDTALQRFSIRPRGVSEAIASALRNEDQTLAATRWSDATSVGGLMDKNQPTRYGNRLVDMRKAYVDVTPEEAFVPIRRIGGRTGYYYAGYLWRLRGFLDVLVGGIGICRGRRDPEWLSVGDTLDWWRVECFELNKRLRLRAEMKLPGRAWLEFEVQKQDEGSTIRQTAIFDPLGVLGLLYWYATYPVHQLIFPGMLRGIVMKALEFQDSPSTLEKRHVQKLSHRYRM